MVIRKTLEAILDNYSGDKESAEYEAFLIYAKRVFFANGIHHHYSNDKLKPGYSESYFASLIDGIDRNYLPLSAGQTVEEFISILADVIFDEKLFGRKVEQRKGADMVAESAVNFYENVNQKEVEDFYKGKK
jgi:dipeptidyl-peptidase-3